jgi:hypothetical protein
MTGKSKSSMNKKEHLKTESKRAIPMTETVDKAKAKLIDKILKDLKLKEDLQRKS